MTEQSNNKAAIEQYRSRYQDAVKLLAAGQVQKSVLACRSESASTFHRTALPAG
jgi:hypothetical protein